jgi:YegS/Rv2252/BmrU family lipid kinase
MKDIAEPAAGTGRTSESKRYLVIFNPVAGNRRRRFLDRTLARLAALGCLCELKETTCRGDAEAICAAVVPGDYDAVLVAGGDGTVNEALNGIGERPIPVGVIPIGTANVLALELGLPDDPEKVADCLASSPVRRLHYGAVNGRRFTMMAGVGFDALVVAAVTPELKRRLRKAAYVLKSFLLLMRFDRPAYEVSVDGVTSAAASVIVANGHFYGGKFICAPEARLDDPDLHVCLFERSGRFAAATYALWLLIGRLHRRHDFRVLRGRDIRIGHPAGDPVQADGDIVAASPVSITASAGTFDALAPAT